MDVTIQAVLNGEYPFSIKDHLGQTSSNLPGLFYLGLPFYLIGDVGFFQPFCFLLVSFCLFKTKTQNFNKILILILLLLSPAYLWGITVKSDLMSNIILLVIFIYYWGFKYKGNYFSKPIVLSFFCAFFFLTRGIVVIPLLIFLFKPFIQLQFINQLKFIAGFFCSLLLISLPFLITIPSLDILIQFNPYNHQTRYAPKMLQIIFIILSFLVAFNVRYLLDVFKFSFILLSIMLFLIFGINILEEGFSKNLFGNLFDISYLGMVLPFAILCIFFMLKFQKKKILCTHNKLKKNS